MVNCAICGTDTEGADVDFQGKIICMNCFIKMEQEAPAQKAPEEKKIEKKEEPKPKKTEESAPKLCSICNTPLDSSTLIEGAEDLCLNCFVANAPEEDKVTKGMENYNDLTDPSTQNFVIVSLYKEEEESTPTESKEGHQPNPVSVRYLNIAKKNPANIEILDIQSPITELPSAFPDYFASIVPLSPYQFLVTGGAKINPNGSSTPLSQCLAVVINKYSRYFCFGPLKTLSTGRFAHSSIIVDEYLYVMGGIQKVTTDDSFWWSGSCEKFHLKGLKDNLDMILFEGDRSAISSTKWEEVAKLNKPRANFSTFEHEGHIYAFGGFYGPNQLEQSIEKYDPATNKWEILDWKQKLQKINYSFLASSLLLKSKDQIYIVGGTDGRTASKQVVKLNTKTLEFENFKSLNNGRAGAQGFVAEKTLYIFGGEINQTVFETLDLTNSEAGFKVHNPPDEFDRDSGLLGRGFVGNFGFFIQ